MAERTASLGKRPRAGSEVSECPAFKNGCPFSGESRVACPAFTEGCPFKHARTAAELEAVLARVPESHGVEGSPAQSALVALLGATHKTSLKLSGTCPVFASECPFKNVGPLRKSAEKVWAGWWTFEDEEEDMVLEGPLSSRLKQGTQVAHAEAENVKFVKALLERRAPLPSYVALLAALRRVYAALEDAADRVHDGPCASICVDWAPKLRRAGQLDRDLEHFATRDAAAVAAATKFAENSPAVRAYVRRLEALDAPELLVAHLYTRYLGDLSGGQILKRAVKRSYLGDDDARGVDFYNFPLVGGPIQLRRFKEEYRSQLDTLQVDLDPVVKEAVRAFRHNTALLSELDAFLAMPPDHPPIAPRRDGQTCPFLAGPRASASTASSSSGAACPFAAATPRPIAATTTTTCPFAKTRDAPPSKCPFHNFGLKDIAIVGFLAVAMIYLATLAKEATATPYSVPFSSS
ncbi:hypothetical protein CTAYLR_001582 [Chrysophaeum taylorii]|uniref:Uncharacterized protein n=1 Tax=Chrysophaeum taylorii TaxID=2483200 RepID=A0AAD7XIK8_9STRA|nr:hypothetical protein CTAYLR_001582 [Chrysophaeum taylorii]